MCDWLEWEEEQTVVLALPATTASMEPLVRFMTSASFSLPLDHLIPFHSSVTVFDLQGVMYRSRL